MVLLGVLFWVYRLKSGSRLGCGLKKPGVSFCPHLSCYQISVPVAVGLRVLLFWMRLPGGCPQSLNSHPQVLATKPFKMRAFFFRGNRKLSLALNLSFQEGPIPSDQVRPTQNDLIFFINSKLSDQQPIQRSEIQSIPNSFLNPRERNSSASNLSWRPTLEFVYHTGESENNCEVFI